MVDGPDNCGRVWASWDSKGEYLIAECSCGSKIRFHRSCLIETIGDFVKRHGQTPKSQEPVNQELPWWGS